MAVTEINYIIFMNNLSFNITNSCLTFNSKRSQKKKTISQIHMV